MLLGRDRELARLGRMLDAAQHGPSSAVIMHGDPGVGKTALLDAAAGIARGFTVLRARPLQAESELPFAGLADLLRPLLGLLDRIPPPQAAALSGALAIGPATPGDRFAAAAATISLLAAGGEASPVLAVIDDAQWLDTPSREALLFTARRLGSERVVLLFAMRDRPWRSTSRIDGLELPGLGTDAAAALVTRSGKIVSPAVRDRLVGETAGNPLAITEALANLRDDQLTGSIPIAGPIAAVAQRLEQTAAGAQARHGYIAAANALATAPRLSPANDDLVRRTIGAGNAFRLGGQARAANDLLLGLLAEVSDPLLRADVQLVRGSALMMIAPAQDSAALLVEEAGRVQALDPARAAYMLVTSAVGAVAASDIPLAVDVASRAVQVAQTAGGPVTMVADLAFSFALGLAGRVGEARALLEPLLPMLGLLDPLGQEGRLLVTAGHLLVWIEEWDHARRTFERLISTARTAGAVTMLPHPLAVLAELEVRRGRLTEAYSAASEAVEISIDIGEGVQEAVATVALARIEAVLGLEATCRAHAAAALEAGGRLGLTSINNYTPAALGMLELSLGRPDRAAEQLHQCSKLEHDLGVGLPTAVPWNGDLVESYVRLDRYADAFRELDSLEAQATATGIGWAAAVAARGRGLLAAEEQYPADFAQAIELHGEHDLYELGRTLLCFGRRLRHSRRRAQARTQLRGALAAFEAVGAQLWADQTRAELRATGETTTAQPAVPAVSLTPQELHVALRVASGATNKEAAAGLFISAKTVEFHLSNIYQKLGLRSRTELTRRMSEASNLPRQAANGS